MRENRRWTFSLEEALLWKFWSAVIVWSENALMQDLFLTSMHLLALQDVNWKGKDMWPSMVCNSPFHHSKRTHTAVSSEHTHAHAHTHTHTHTHYNPCQYRDLNPWPLGYTSPFDGLKWCGLLVMFLSAVWTLILTAPIHCRASIGETLMQRHISPNLMKKQTHLHLWCSEGEHIFS